MSATFWAKAAIALALLAALAAVAFGVNHWDNQRLERAREEGRAQIRAEWNAAAVAESQANAEETTRRLAAQEENQRAQDAELARLRAAADRNAADADRVREQAADNARAWGRRLADSPTGADLEAAAAAIRVQAELLGRLDRRAGILATYADTARAAGRKCEVDYDALIQP